LSSIPSSGLASCTASPRTGRYVIAPEHETSAAAEPREHLARQVWR
jgi:hypothetical protein